MYGKKKEKALSKVEKTHMRRAYDYVAIANPENGLAWFNLCKWYTKWHDKANRFVVNMIIEPVRTSPLLEE
ncbi:hypothetical protein GOP47_0023889 [Adiantum capillus-veneris]|uniref:Uncharacterized protein n=1 Tax=Adiantum capillus-veneris TaxID=13818 RepID=A0A9D4U4D0_ADICA|nr:hypothetical protein GOP47_0023889 [Adiantum capillus-veneris]